jgi:hypothetical protein
MASHHPPLLREAPVGEELTDYDREHFGVYLLLLDWSAAGADWRHSMKELALEVLIQDPEAARQMYDTHLERALWMTRTGS